MTVLSLGLGWLVAGRVLQPVQRINEAARRIGASNLHERLRLDGPNDEFRELGATLDDLLGRLEASFEAQRRFVANASHELRTPLTLDRALLERALRQAEPTDSFWRTTCDRLLASSEQQDRLVEALLTLARSEGTRGRHECCELDEIVQNVLLHNTQPDADNTGLQIRTRIERAPVIGEPRLLERLVRNLLDNAIGHNVPGGEVHITTTVLDGQVLLTIANTGPVVPASEITRLLEPFQRATTDRTTHGNGHGLGLSIVSAIAAAHRAQLTVRPRPQGGLQIEARFPPASSAFN
jgi:signal transduction histidine kinase